MDPASVFDYYSNPGEIYVFAKHCQVDLVLSFGRPLTSWLIFSPRADSPFAFRRYRRRFRSGGVRCRGGIRLSAGGSAQTSHSPIDASGVDINDFDTCGLLKTDFPDLLNPGKYLPKGVNWKAIAYWDPTGTETYETNGTTRYMCRVFLESKDQYLSTQVSKNDYREITVANQKRAWRGCNEWSGDSDNGGGRVTAIQCEDLWVLVALIGPPSLSASTPGIHDTAEKLAEDVMAKIAS